MMLACGTREFCPANIPKGNPTAPQPLDEAQPAATKSLNEQQPNPTAPQPLDEAQPAATKPLDEAQPAATKPLDEAQPAATVTVTTSGCTKTSYK